MKKIRLMVVFLFAVLMISGCSCTKSMCSGEDTKLINEKIREKWENDDQYRVKLEEEAMSKDITDPVKIDEYVDQHIEDKIKSEISSHPGACLTTEKMTDPSSGAEISAKNWTYAFKKGLLEGLIVFPIAWLLITFTSLFGGGAGAKVLSIVITTIIIKILTLLITFKQQLQTHKLQAIQPELNELNKKLSDPTLSQNEKYRLQMRMMELYKKNNINPISSLIMPFISLPIFIAVWAAVNETLVIRTGDFLGIGLGDAVSSQVFGLNIGAILLFLLMSALQILSMKMPNILRVLRASEREKEKIKESNNQMKMMTNIMIFMILFTGFMLPAAIAVYWTVGALFSIIQTLVFSSPKVKEKISALSNRKKKAKVVE